MREAARKVASRLIEDRGENGKISEFAMILTKENPDEATQAQQSIIKQYLGGHLLDPSFRAFALSNLRGSRLGHKKDLDAALSQALAMITGDDIKGWFAHCGYGDALN